MIRPENFDVLVCKERRNIIQVLSGKELQLGEIREMCKLGSRQNAYHHLNLLIKANLVSRKTIMRKNWSVKAKRTHSQVFRYILTPEGESAKSYFSIIGGV